MKDANGKGPTLTMDEMEACLVNRARAGDSDAFAALVCRHQRMVYNLALKILGDSHQAGDVQQEVFLSALRSVGKFRGEASFSTWLYRIALNACRRALKKRPPPARALSEAADVVQRDGAEEALVVQDALSQLPDKHRIALVLHCMFSYTYDEAGKLMGVPAGTVKSYVYRGKRALRHILAEETEDAMQ